QLGQGGGVHPVGVPQQRDQQVTHHHGIGHGVLVLQQGGGLGPVVAGGDLGGGQALVPDIPLVERNVDALLVTAGGTHRIGGRGHGVDEDRKSTRLNSSHVSISYAV